MVTAIDQTPTACTRFCSYLHVVPSISQTELGFFGSGYLYAIWGSKNVDTTHVHVVFVIYTKRSVRVSCGRGSSVRPPCRQ